MAKLPDYTALGEPAAPAVPGGIAQVGGPIDAAIAPARALIGAGAQIEGAAGDILQAKDRLDTTRTEDAFNQLRRQQLDLTIGPDGFTQTKGAGAIDPKFYDTSVKRFDDAAKQVGDGLTDPDQVRMFRARADVAGLQYKEQLLAHIHSENDTYQSQTNNAVIQTEAQNIAANYHNPQAVALSQTRIDAAIDREMERKGTQVDENGATHPAKLEMQQKASDLVWTTRLAAQAVNDPVGALKDFNVPENKAQISPVLREQLFHQLTAAATPIEAKRAADRIMSGNGSQNLPALLTVGGTAATDGLVAQNAGAAPGPGGSPAGTGAPGLPTTGSKFDIKGNLLTWMEDAEKDAQLTHPNDPVYRDHLIAEIRGRVNTMVAAQDGIARQAHAALMSAARGQPGQTPPLLLSQMLTTPALVAAWDASDPNGQRGILALLEHNARAAQGVPIKSDAKVMEQVWRRINLPATDPQKIRMPSQLAPYLAHGLNTENYDWFKKRIDESQTDEGRNLADTRKAFLDASRAQFDHSTMMLSDGKGKMDAFKFAQYATQQEALFRATPGKDPYQLYNPESPDFLGKKIPGFQRTLEQQIRDMSEEIQRGAGAAPAPANAPAGAAPFAAAPAAPGYDIGKTYSFRQGKFKYTGGDPSKATSFQAVP